MTPSKDSLGFQQTWSMAVGGMVGGGIFSTLGVVIGVAGSWAWLSFLVAGIIAWTAGYSYVKLALHYKEGGGAFTFLREMNLKGFAGGLSWILIFGYILTNAVYAFTFGEYLANVIGLGPWFPRAAAAGILLLFIGLNLTGTGEAGGVEVVLVWFKLLVLFALALWGIFEWSPEQLSHGLPDAGFGAALFGAASVFMAYEGFQLLTYDYDDIRNPEKTLPRSILSAIILVTILYVLVTLGIPMLIGADAVVNQKEVALAVAGEKILGTAGLIIVTIGAAFSTGSAINSTLFSTARLSKDVAERGELPVWFAHNNSNGVPDRSLIALGIAAGVLAVIGSLTMLVEAASLAFLFAFSVVSILAFRADAGNRFITGFGSIASTAGFVALIVRLIQHSPLSLLFLGIVIGVVLFVRPLILRHVATDRSMEQTDD